MSGGPAEHHADGPSAGSVVQGIGHVEHHADGPSAGSVVLEIGGGIGALVLYAPAEMDGAEIEISRAQDPPARRTHSLVRLRRGAVTHAAVYPGLPAGTYTIWRDAGTPAGTAVVRGGEVASFHWPRDATLPPAERRRADAARRP